MRNKYESKNPKPRNTVVQPKGKRKRGDEQRTIER
jgi:hypothetical protein